MHRLLPLAAFLVLSACSSSEPIVMEAPELIITPSGTSIAVDAVGDKPTYFPADPPLTFERAVRARTRTRLGQPGPNYWINQAAYTIDARLDPDAKRLSGSMEVTYTNNSPDTLDIVRFEVAQNGHAPGAIRTGEGEVTGGMIIERLAADGSDLAQGELRESGARYVVEGTQVIVTLPRPLMPGASMDYEVDFSFVIAQKGAGGRMGYDGGTFFLGYWYPQIATYDDLEGWFTDRFTLGAEFYHDFSSYDLTIRVPQDYLVMSTGDFLNLTEVLRPEVVARMKDAHASDETVVIVSHEQARAGQATQAGPLIYRFRANHVPDVTFSATRNAQWDGTRSPIGDRDGDGATDYAAINTFWRESAPRWANVSRYQQHSLDFLSRSTGIAYPWPHMTAVEGENIIGGGMEFPQMTIMGSYTRSTDDRLYSVTAHELTHMWTPMLVQSNERRHSWMDEGATAFLTSQAKSDFLGDKEDWDANEQGGYIRVALNEGESELTRRSDYHYDGAANGVASYAKPASGLMALRGILGEETFQRAWRAYLADWAYKHPAPHDLFHTFERVSGRDLDWFWYSWYYTTRTIDQAVGQVDVVDGETRVEIRNEGDVPMPILLVGTTASGETVEHRVEVDVWLRGAAHTSVTFDQPLVRVEIDPELHFADVDRSNNIWTR